MKKLALIVEDLKVESFDIVTEPDMRGTVKGHDSFEDETATCQNTCEYSCYGTCYASCRGTCFGVSVCGISICNPV